MTGKAKRGKKGKKPSPAGRQLGALELRAVNVPGLKRRFIPWVLADGTHLFVARTCSEITALKKRLEELGLSVTIATNQREASHRVFQMAHEDDHVDGSAFAGEDFALMTVKEACADARISPATFYRLVKNDPNFPNLVKIGGGTRVRSGEWRRYLAKLPTADGTDNADGFQHIAGPANHVAEQVVSAAIKQAERDGDFAMAERLRRCWRDSMKERSNGA